ncbi:CRIB domain-containing protein RIC7 [Macadamia integrifolia]|uniref:CRIB domain-containing protein RIC7 n=1 Tax=Macadamia integrifolia TaxID=60698 RepID=UPI001C4F36A6|nr:CRIB domain-containing protein RIC7 [Macadamia integrifolia]
MSAESNHAEPVKEYSLNLTPYGESSTETSQESSSDQSKPSKTLSLNRKKQKEIFQPPEMSTKMKGLLKGLRYISQIFDNNGKEQEMQIGFPTDVKHVAHIGWDGPAVHSPSWMDEHRPGPNFSSAPLSTNGDANESNRKSASLEEMPELSKPSTYIPSSLDSPASRDQSKKSRRHHTTTGISISSPSRDTKERSSRPSSSSRRSQNTGGLSMDSTLQDPAADPKKSRRKKPKGISSSGSTKPSRSKPQSTTTYTSPFSDPGSGSISVLNNEPCPTSPLRSLRIEDGDKGNHGIS